MRIRNNYATGLAAFCCISKKLLILQLSAVKMIMITSTLIVRVTNTCTFQSPILSKTENLSLSTCKSINVQEQGPSANASHLILCKTIKH